MVSGSNGVPDAKGTEVSGRSSWTIPTAETKNVAVATIERNDNLDTPQSICPDVHPLDNLSFS